MSNYEANRSSPGLTNVSTLTVISMSKKYNIVWSAGNKVSRKSIKNVTRLQSFATCAFFNDHYSIKCRIALKNSK